MFYIALQDNWGFILLFIWYFFLWLKNSKPSFYFFVKFLPWTRCSYALHSYHSTMLPVISLSPLLHSISWKPTIEPLMSSLNQLDAWILWFLMSVISCIFPMYMCFTVKTSFIFFFLKWPWYNFSHLYHLGYNITISLSKMILNREFKFLTLDFHLEELSRFYGGLFPLFSWVLFLNY